MPTGDDYRRKASEFRRLAERAIELDVKAAFQSLAESYDRLADVTDRGHTKVKPAPSRVTGDDK
jgi:hypothetical protein